MLKFASHSQEECENIAYNLPRQERNKEGLPESIFDSGKRRSSCHLFKLHGHAVWGGSVLVCCVLITALYGHAVYRSFVRACCMIKDSVGMLYAPAISCRYVVL